MDDIGNIIYLIVLLLSFVFGLWQKANKKKQGDPSSESTLDEVFETFERQEPQHRRDPVVVDPEEQERALAKDQQAASRLQEMEEKARQARAEAGSIRRRAEERKLQVLETKEEETIDFDLSDFDARKAVIYSEILNPPYL